MLLGITNYQQIKLIIVQDHIFTLAALLATENILYIFLSYLLLKHFKKQTSKLNPFGKFVCYKIFDKTYISNFPSRSGKRFFNAQNTVTHIFNFLIAGTFITYTIIIIRSL